MILSAKAGGHSDPGLDVIRQVRGGQEMIEHHCYRVFLHLSVAAEQVAIICYRTPSHPAPHLEASLLNSQTRLSRH